jgi:hypothetical protein
MNLKLPLLLFAVMGAGVSIGQSTQTLKLLPVLVPPTPEAAAIARFGNYEVSEYTGVPNISIPIYNIKVGELQVPISLNYHAGGIKVSDVATRAGLGWSLDAGGTITRQVRGKADEIPYDNYFAATPSSPSRVKDGSEINESTDSSLTYLYNIDHNVYDVEPDIFSYSFPGHNGKFLFNQKDNFKAFIIPYSPISITKTQPTSSTLNFDIVDEGGIDYQFNTYEWTSTGGGISVDQSSAWKLSNMISANKQDTINFVYGNGWGMTSEYFSDYVTFNDGIIGEHWNYDTPTYSTDQGSVYTSWERLDQINFRNGKVVIEGASADRTDFSGTERPINDIKVYSYDPVSNTYSLIKTIQFFHSYFQNGSQRLKLDSLQIRASNDVAVQTYKFDYNTTISMPGYMSRSKDFWGYFNNKSGTDPFGNPTMIPRTVAPYSSGIYGEDSIIIGSPNDSTIRDPNPNYMQADILEKITFPTGGYTEFTYETNQYLDANNNPKYAGGLRVKTIKTYENPSATPLIKTYKYGVGETGYGRANFFLESCFFSNHQRCINVHDDVDGAGQCMPYSYRTLNTYFANPTNDIEGFNGSPVVYSQVTEYTGDNTSNNGKIVYKFTDKPDAKTDAIGVGKPYFDSYHFVRGLLTNKMIYKNDGSNNYVLLSEDRKGYQFFPFQWSTGGIGIIVSKKVNDDGGSSGDADEGLSARTMCYTISDEDNYNYNFYDIVSGDNKLVADTSIVYDQNDPTKSISTITSYTYDDLSHLGLSQTKTTNSLGQTLRDTVTYPYDYTNYPYYNMDAAHIWDKPITETKFNGTTQLSRQTTNYAWFNTNLYLPQTISLQIKNNPEETRALFNSYDNRGNILEMQKANDEKQSIIWDYRGMYPVAQVTGAAQADIAYTSFESDGTGNWSNINTSNIVNNAFVTGQRSYKSSSFSISKSGLTSSTTYVVSYWSTSGSYSISGTQSGYPKALKTLTINGQSWTCYLHQVTGVTTVTVSGNGGIDELRLYPLGSMMNTYCYTPLVGMNTQCDANNHLIFEKYDEAGRLILVLDENSNILKKYCYNYYNQSGSCSVYTNVAESRTYTTSCGTGYTGGSVIYTVPAGKYYSTLSQAYANSKASADTAANGQNYANAFGTCTPISYTITGSDSKSISYTVRFTLSSNSSINYSLSLYSGASNANIGQIPAGTYTVQFQPGGMPVTANFSVNSYTMSNVNGATFYNVPITGPSTVRVY